MPSRRASRAHDSALSPHPASPAGPLAGGCTTLGPNFQPPGWSGPGSWFGGGKPRAPVSQTVEAPIDPNWWTLFKDPTLTALEQRVANENLDVAIAAARIEESRAQYEIAAAAGIPSINGNASYTRQKASNVGVFANAPNPLGASGISGSTAGALGSHTLNAFDVYQVGLRARRGNSICGARSAGRWNRRARRTQASEDDRRGVLLANLAEVARDYITLRGVQTELRIARDNARIAQDSLKLTQQRAAGGVTTNLDVANAQAQLSTTLAQIPTSGAAGSATDQRALAVVGHAAERAARGTGDAARGAAGAAAGAGRPAVGTGAAAARTCGRRRLSCMPRPPTSAWREAAFYPSVTLSGSVGSASDPVRPAVRLQRAAVRARSGRIGADFRRWSVEGNPASDRGAAERGGGDLSADRADGVA